MKKKIIWLGIFIILSRDVVPQSHNWVRTNPGGGGAFSTIGASKSCIIIAGSDLSGAYRSIDNGQSWDVIGADKGLTETHVSGVGFHRVDGDIIFIGTENGIFRSDDGGYSVTRVLNSGYITDIEFSLNNPQYGYASYHTYHDSLDGTVYKTNDSGISWYPISTNLPNDIRILKIVVNPQNANTLYILTGNGRFACSEASVYKSTDGGVTWDNITGMISGEILDMAINPQNPDVLYITTMHADCNAQYYWTDMDGSLYRSTNEGASWTHLSGYTGVIWIDNTNPSTIRLIDPREPYPWNPYAGTFTSTDGGNNFIKTGDVEDWDTFFQGEVFWAYSSSFNGICKTLGEDLSDPDNYYWVNSQWVFGTSDSGSTFHNLFTDEVTSGWWRSRGFDNVNMMDISISEANPSIVYLAYFDIGIWRSLDGGESWQSGNDSYYSGSWEGFGGNCATVLADPDRENVVWASLSENQSGEPPTYLLKSSQYGQKDSWMLSNSGLPDREIMGLSIDYQSNTNNRTLFVTADKDVYKSTDDGSTWTQVFNCNGCRFTAVDHFNGNIVYAGGENGIWKSTDGGTSWTDISHPEMNATYGTDFWAWNYQGIFDVVTDPNQPGYIYVTVFGTGKGLYKSTDGGITWTKILTDDFMRKVAVVPGNSNQIYATSSSAFDSGGYSPGSSGIYYSDDGGTSWSIQNQGMAYPFAMSVGITGGDDPMVFIGSPGTGFQKSSVPENISVSDISLQDTTVTLYPNPAINSTIISGNDLVIQDYKIFLSTGQNVTGNILTKELDKNKIQIRRGCNFGNQRSGCK
jgi:photosystem II stability/assembly factor-like uncharacterized protein